MLGLYGTAQLPVTAAGIILLVAGIGLIIAEAHLATFGILGVIGVIALALSGLMLFDTDAEGFEVSAPLVIGVAVALGGLLAIAVRKVVEARRDPVLDRARRSWPERRATCASRSIRSDRCSSTVPCGAPSPRMGPTPGRFRPALECGSNRWTA